MSRVKIVLDADVLIHFSKGGYLSVLPDIFSNYEHIILSTVYNELIGDVRKQVDNIISSFKTISLVKFEPKAEMKREYAILSSTYGKGESACMAYCRFNNDVIGSSNLKDIKSYCESYNITYLTTIDFLYYAIKKGKISKKEAETFVGVVNAKNSKLPVVDFDLYVSTAII